MGNNNHSGYINTNIYLSIAYNIIAKGRKEDRPINDTEVLGLALMLQGKYGYVEENKAQEFQEGVLSAKHLIEKTSKAPVSKKAHAKYKLDDTLGANPLHEDYDPEGNPV